MAKRGFGELESQIMLLMKPNERKTVKDVHQALGGKDNYNTIMTVMTRLSQKKILGRERIGLQYEYWSLKDFNSASIFDKLKHKFLGVKTTALVSHLIESAEDLTDEEITEMERIIQAHKLRASKK